jgi:hypothetical protein
MHQTNCVPNAPLNTVKLDSTLAEHTFQGLHKGVIVGCVVHGDPSNLLIYVLAFTVKSTDANHSSDLKIISDM